MASLTVKLIAQTEQFMSAMGQANKSLSGIQRTVHAATKVMGGLAAAMGAIGGVRGLARSIDEIDKIGKLSTRLGATTEALSELRHAAELSGLAFTTVTMAMQRSTRRIAEAAAGTGEAKKALEELGLSAQRLNNMRPEQQLEVLADALAGVGNDADKVRIAMKLFDSEGVSMIQMLDGGSAGLRQMRDEARRMGVSLDENATRAAAEANNSFARLEAATNALEIAMARELGPTLSAIAEFLAEVIPPAANAVGFIFDKIRAVILKFASQVATAIAKLNQLFGMLPDVMGGDTFRANAAMLLEHAEAMSDVAEAYWNNVEGAAQATKKWADSATTLATIPVTGGAVGAIAGAGSGAGAAPGSFRGAQEAGMEESPAVKALMAEHAYLEELKAQQAAEAHALEIERQTLNFEMLGMNKFELLDKQLAAELEWIATARETKQQTEEYYDQLEREAVERNERAKIDIKRQMAQEALSLADQLGSSLFGKSKKWFKVQKTVQAAQALVSAHAGAARTLEHYPWPLAGALAALHWAAGLARVKAIMSTSPGGGSGGGTGPTGGGASMTSSAMDSGATQAQQQANVPRTVTINLGDDDGLISKKAVRGLIGLINEQIGDGVRIIGGEVPA